MKKFFFTTSKPIQKDFGLLLIRVILGVLMAFYGYEKWSHFETMAASDFWSKNVNFLGMTGKIPLMLTIFAELFCSILLILGLFYRFSLAVLMFCMGYIFMVVFPLSIVSLGDNGYEINHAFLYFILYLALFLTGSGRYSFDHRFFSKNKS